MASATNYKAINVGKLNEVSDYVLELGPDVKIPGKVFGGQALGDYHSLRMLERRG